MANSKSKERRSLCEESMLVIVNILKLSSFSLAGKSLSKTTTRVHESPEHKKIIKEPAILSPEGALSSRDGSKRAQYPQRGPKISYVIPPTGDEKDEASASSYVVHEASHGDGRFSDYIKRFHEKAENDMQNAIVEGKAADYIKRFHEKNRNDVKNESRRSSYKLPPPLHQVHKNK